MKILVADDNPVIRDVLKSMLQSWGYEAATAADGDEALAALQRSDAPRLAILDWMMPGVDGVDVCRSIRNRLSHRDIYVVILTARAAGEDLLAAMDAGADDYLTKPFKSQELRARLRAAGRMIELEEQARMARLSPRVAVHTAPSFAV